ncbi:hypothetical protein KV205_27525 [Streptomyces sp. SKN60]|uniref:hypothetical protein n=1 Tax=Streptomyces sp. SKN60 TaxID=2855506 RepID=UPI0022462D1B|nr:hypothetical protein [Streptomyces sp. SKN60]MCX2184251.1 hypothetical protein [Streptomyces sp. SKN60]
MNDPQHQTPGLHIHGSVSGSQIAVGNEQVTQNQINHTAAAEVAPEHAELAELVRELLLRLPEQGLGDPEREDTEAAAHEVLDTISGTAEPEPGRLRRALTLLRGALAPVATGVAAGATAGSQQWAQNAIASLTGM